MSTIYGIEHLVDGEWHTHATDDRHLVDEAAARRHASGLVENGTHREGARVVRYAARLVEEPAPARETTPPTADWEPDESGDALDWSASIDRHSDIGDHDRSDTGWEISA